MGKSGLCDNVMNSAIFGKGFKAAAFHLGSNRFFYLQSVFTNKFTQNLLFGFRGGTEVQNPHRQPIEVVG